MRLKFLGGGLVIKDPIGVEILEWCRDVNQNVFCGGGVGGGVWIFSGTIQFRLGTYRVCLLLDINF